MAASAWGITSMLMLKDALDKERKKEREKRKRKKKAATQLVLR